MATDEGKHDLFTPETSSEEAVGDPGLQRRQLIRSAIASVPVVLTVTAGTARAQGGGSMGSGTSGGTAPETSQLDDALAPMDDAVNGETEPGIDADLDGNPVGLSPDGPPSGL